MEHRTRKRDYMAAVERTREYIAAGDVFQAVISQRFDVDPGVDTFQVYRALRTVNPKPLHVLSALCHRWSAGLAKQAGAKGEGARVNAIEN